MSAHSAALPLALLTVLTLGGCMVSAQDGERRHVNSPAPDEMAFHFDTGFNRTMVWGRSAALALLGLWLVGRSDRRNRKTTVLVATVPLLVVAGWWLQQGQAVLGDYRIEVLPDRIVIAEPTGPEASYDWEEIEGLFVEGTTRPLNTGIKNYEEYERMEILVADGERRVVDLRPLSPEQRGTLWQAVVSRARLVRQR